ncbi:hypothetical protein Q5752_005973 [Cryptotrichosporon argae]
MRELFTDHELGVSVVGEQVPADGWAIYTPPTRKYTLVFIVNCQSRKVLLGLKKRGFGLGMWNGFGGKVEPGETVLRGAEECGLCLGHDDVRHAADFAIVYIDAAGRAAETIDCAVYAATAWHGEPVDTDEMRPEWVAVDHLPYDDMWADARHWVPEVLGRVLDGNKERLSIRVDYRGEDLAGWWIAAMPAEQ